MAGEPHDAAPGREPLSTIVGFENHGGRTFLGPTARPLGTVLAGHGNNARDDTEGAVSNNVFGTYLHGSLLPKNPHFADHLLELALARRYGVEAARRVLIPLDDRAERHAHLAVRERWAPTTRWRTVAAPGETLPRSVDSLPAWRVSSCPPITAHFPCHVR